VSSAQWRFDEVWPSEHSDWIEERHHWAGVSDDELAKLINQRSTADGWETDNYLARAIRELAWRSTPPGSGKIARRSGTANQKASLTGRLRTSGRADLRLLYWFTRGVAALLALAFLLVMAALAIGFLWLPFGRAAM
jgi:hypothetical protein